MLTHVLLLIPLLLVELCTAHFQVNYPYWRGDSFLAPASQYTYPCAGVNQSVSANNRTLWPLDGGSVNLDLHHPWSFVFINLDPTLIGFLDSVPSPEVDILMNPPQLNHPKSTSSPRNCSDETFPDAAPEPTPRLTSQQALGSNITTSFNITLTNPFWNETGAGTICVPKLTLPPNLRITEGANASLQFVTSGNSGSALYNCADITFSSKASLLSGDRCVNTTGTSVALVLPQINGTVVGGGGAVVAPANVTATVAPKSGAPGGAAGGGAAFGLAMAVAAGAVFAGGLM